MKISNIVRILTVVSLCSLHTLKAVTVSVTNKTNDTLEYVSATFKFSGETGSKKGVFQRKKNNLKGKATINDLAAGKTATLHSNDALYKGGKAIDQFKGGKLESVSVEKVEAGNMKIKGTNIGIGGAQEDVTKEPNVKSFNVVTKENKLGISYYDIEPVQSFFN